MRHIQVTIPIGKRKALLALLDDEGIDYVVTDETSTREYDAVVSFPVPTNAVEPILDSLQETGIDEDAHTVVLDAETVLESEAELSLLEVEVEVHGDGFPLDRSLDATQQIDVVVIEVGGPPGAYDEEVVTTLEERINAHTSGETEVQVRFITTGGAELDQPTETDGDIPAT